MQAEGVTDRAKTTEIDYEAFERGFECPLMTAMRAIERVLPQERAARAYGDVARAERLRAEREGWRHLYNIACQRICVALRQGPMGATAAEAMADEALVRMPHTVPTEQLAALRRQLTNCAMLASPDDCPVLRPRVVPRVARPAHRLNGGGSP